jgi:hypothetical protein
MAEIIFGIYGASVLQVKLQEIFNQDHNSYCQHSFNCYSILKI